MIIPLLGLLMITAILIFYASNRSKIALSYTNCLLAFPTKKTHTTSIIIIIAYCINFSLFIKEFSILNASTLMIVSIFASYTAVKDAIYWKYSGIYADFILLHGKKVQKSQVISFDDEDATIPSNTIKGLSKKQGSFFLTFDNAEQCQKARTILKAWYTKD
ncbi:MAG: hypothetical protein ACRC5H_05680 [Treponemataceae bacterium]